LRALAGGRGVSEGHSETPSGHGAARQITRVFVNVNGRSVGYRAPSLCGVSPPAMLSRFLRPAVFLREWRVRYDCPVSVRIYFLTAPARRLAILLRRIPVRRNTGNSEACHFTVAQTAGFRQFFSQLRCRFLTFAEASLDLPFRCFLLPRQSVYGFWRRKATRRFV
jgi:hypothetical protein